MEEEQQQQEEEEEEEWEEVKEEWERRRRRRRRQQQQQRHPSQSDPGLKISGWVGPPGHPLPPLAHPPTLVGHFEVGDSCARSSARAQRRRVERSGDSVNTIGGLHFQ